MKKQNNEKLRGNRIAYIVISLLIAILLWMYVEYIEQPNIEQSFSHIPVVFNGVGELEKNGLVLVEGEESYVGIKLKGTRSTVSKITADDIIVTSDLSSITVAGEYQRSYSVTLPGDVSADEVTVTTRNPQTIYIRIENLMSKTVPVYGTLEGRVAEEHAAEEFVFDPAEVTVTGAEGIVNPVEYAYVVINMDNVGETIEKDVEFTLMTAEKEVVDKEDVELSTQLIHAMLPIVKVKTLPLSVEFTPGGGLTEENVDCVIEPTEITVSGDESVLDEMTELNLGTVALGEMLTGELETTFDIVLPQGVKSISGETEATVYISVNENTVTQSYLVNSIKLDGTPESFVATPVTQTLTVDLRGTAEAFEMLEEAEIWAVADLSGLTMGSGTYTVPVTIEINGVDGIGAVGEYSIYVELSEV